MKQDTPEIVLVLDDIRSASNVGSIIRSCDGFGVKHVYMCGITPYPKQNNDTRLPHVIVSTTKKIAKTSLGAENSVECTYEQNIEDLISRLKNKYEIVAIEQASNSQDLNHVKTSANTCLVLGNEINGVNKKILEMSDHIVEINMMGKKESFNVAVSAGIVLFKYTSK